MANEKLIKGLKFIRISIIILCITALINGVFWFIFNMVLLNSRDFDLYFKLFRYATFINVIASIATIVTYVLIGIGLYKIKKNSSKIGKDHSSDMKWAVRFFWVTIGLFVTSFIVNFSMNFISYEYLFVRISIASFLYQIISWGMLISVVLVFVLPLRNIAGKGQRNLTSLYAFGRLIIPLFMSLFLALILISQIVALSAIFSNPFFNFAISLLNVTFILIIFRAYHETIKLLNGKPTRILDKKIKFRVPLKRQFEKSLAKPHQIVAVFLVIGVVFGISFGIYDYVRFKNIFSDGGGGSDDTIIITDQETTTKFISQSGHLDEGGTEELDITLGSSLMVDIQVTLTWRDEPVRIGLSNAPDTFVLTTNLVEDIEDPHIQSEAGNEGELFIQYTADENDPFVLGSFTVEITLENTGDITGRAGLITRQTDSGNDYELQVIVEYYEYEEYFL